MADERDPQVSKRYRELGAEEPPRALDEAILAASRRALESRPAPLLGPGGRRRWYFPVAAAAVITLAVAVTVQMEREKPDEAMVATAPPQPRPGVQEQAAPQAKEEKVAPFAQKAPAGSGIAPERKRQAATSEPTDTVGIRGSGPAASPATPPAQAAPPPQPTPAPSDEALRDLAKSNEAATARPGARSDAAGERHAEPAPRAKREAPVAAMAQISPERWLEQIAEMRAQGKHEEADKALEEFRKRYPDYRLSDEVKAKVERK